MDVAVLEDEWRSKIFVIWQGDSWLLHIFRTNQRKRDQQITAVFCMSPLKFFRVCGLAIPTHQKIGKCGKMLTQRQQMRIS
jgi:hypothetical protein